MGRDRFEQLCQKLGFGVEISRNPCRTTDSQGVKRFNNLLKDLKITHRNQVWQSDITYFEVKQRFYYLTFIQDAYTKVIVGYSVSKNLSTQTTTLAALRKALSRRTNGELEGLIVHSDGGGQYYSDAFLELTKSRNILNSMGKEAQQNGMAERLNGVMKNNYLKYQQITCFRHLVEKVDRTVHLYNRDKPHKSLQRKTPFQFEQELLLEAPTRIRTTDSAALKIRYFLAKSSDQGCDDIGKKI